MKANATAGLLAAVVVVSALGALGRDARVVGELGLTVPTGWVAELDRTRSAGGLKAIDVMGRQGQVLTLVPAKPTTVELRVFAFTSGEVANATAWMDRERKRFPVEATVAVTKAGLAGERLDYRGQWSEPAGPVPSFGNRTVEKARVVAVVLQGGKGVYAFELLGGEDEVARVLPQLDAMLDGLRSLR
jgi:hypothetical protein